MTLRGTPGDDGRPPLRPWQQRTLVIVAAVVIVAVIAITLLSGQSFF
ncbi:hypothetical protein [Rathayibacter rathayi]|nr:hypothetical protein [Rathayibacter rathayi]MWV75759.1 hypothetical protein [Rathayibacter rathayi NCPPB 2980 = VKM Ac-1601]TWD70452.1 hypothetical protein FB469_2243 [Rathayibacter rathayi]SOE04332.1 hypothetical protein SAMN06295924_1045 [Rathayibacter rathayi NCPPB 2980 = VKM Ac-1601]